MPPTHTPRSSNTSSSSRPRGDSGHDFNGNGIMSFEAFHRWSDTDNRLSDDKLRRLLAVFDVGVMDSPVEEKQKVLNSLNEFTARLLAMSDGNTSKEPVYLLSSKWWTCWCAYVEAPPELWAGLDEGEEDSARGVLSLQYSILHHMGVGLVRAYRISGSEWRSTWPT